MSTSLMARVPESDFTVTVPNGAGSDCDSAGVAVKIELVVPNDSADVPAAYLLNADMA